MEVQIQSSAIEDQVEFISALTQLEIIVLQYENKNSTDPNRIIKALNSEKLRAILWNDASIFNEETLAIVYRKNPDIRRLVFRFAGRKEPISAESLAPFKNLRWLTLNRFPSDETHLEVILTMTGLEGLCIQTESIPEEDLIEFYRVGRFPKLNYLFVPGITSEQIKHLPDFAPNLSDLATRGKLPQEDRDYLANHISGIGFREEY